MVNHNLFCVKFHFVVLSNTGVLTFGWLDWLIDISITKLQLEWHRDSRTIHSRITPLWVCSLITQCIDVFLQENKMQCVHDITHNVDWVLHLGSVRVNVSIKCNFQVTSRWCDTGWYTEILYEMQYALLFSVLCCKANKLWYIVMADFHKCVMFYRMNH